MDDDEINNIKENLKKLTEKYELLEKENIKNKEKIKKNEESIVILNTQLKQLRAIQLKQESELKELNKKYKQLQKNKENKEAKNEILINNNNNFSLKNIFNQNEEMEKMINKKLKDFEDHLFQQLGKKKPKEKKDKFNDLKEKTLLELFHHKLFKIFYDDNQKIEANDMNELKKISLAFIIQGKDVSNIFGEYLENTLNNNFNQLDEQRKVLIGHKKSEVYFCLEELGEIILNKIDKKNNDEINAFIGELRNKYGISEEDISNDDLNKEIKSNKYDKKKIIESILKKIKLIKEDHSNFF